jgi:putative sterol carrier protein
MVDEELKSKMMSKIDDRSFSPEDLPEFLKLFAEIATESDDIKDEISGWDRSLQFVIEGVGDYCLTVKDAVFTLTAGKVPEPDITLSMAANTAAGVFTGEIDATSAYMGGDLKVMGPLPDAVKFRTLTEIVREELEG